MDWVRMLFTLPAILYSNHCFALYLGAGMGSSPGQTMQLLILLWPIPFCIAYIGLLCKSYRELLFASLLALSVWLILLCKGLFSFIMAYSIGQSRHTKFYVAHILLIGCCAACALLGQQIRRFLLIHLSGSQPTSTPFAS